MNLSLRQLKAFVAVAELHSFTRAAERVHMSQAGLSLMIRDMEEQLNCRLFQRTTRNVAPTAAGLRLLPSVERMLNEIEVASRHAGQLAEEATRTITVAATNYTCADVLPRVLQSFARTHPQFRIITRDVDRTAIPGLVESGMVDVGLGILLKNASGITRKAIADVDLVAVSPGKPGRGKSRWSQLNGSRLLGLPRDNGVQQYVDAQLRSAGVECEHVGQFNTIHTVLAMVEAGFGRAVLPSIVGEACKRYRVHVDNLTHPRAPLAFYAIWQKGAAAAEGIEAFTAAVGDQLQPFAG